VSETVIDPIRKGWTSASNAAADAACPGRHLAQRGIPEPPKSADASHGTLIHQALAATGDDGVTLKKLSLEQREVFDACRDIEKRIVSGYLGDTKDPVRVWRHERSWTKVQPQNYMHSGEADVIYRCGNRAIIADYKTLAGDVQDSPRNLQLRDLAVLVRGALVTVTEVATLIIQPFVTHTPEVCVYGKEDLDKAQAEMFARIIASNDPNSQRVAGEAQCQFCLAANGHCLENQKWASQIAPPQLLTVMETPFALWSPAQRALAAAALGPALDLLEKLKAHLKEGLAKDAEFVPGFYLKPGNKRETITNPQECFTRFAALGGTMEQFMGTIAVGKTALKEAVNQVTGAKGKPLDAAMNALTVGIVEVSQNAPSLKKKEDQ
jgi:hypothetical protein